MLSKDDVITGEKYTEKDRMLKNYTSLLSLAKKAKRIVSKKVDESDNPEKAKEDYGWADRLYTFCQERVAS